MLHKSLTLVEILVASVILALAFGGVFAAFTAARSYATYSNERVVASNLARQVLEDLYDAVSADTWDSGDLQSGVNRTLPAYSIDNQNYGDNPANAYRVNDVAGHQYRSVEVDVSYTSSAGSMATGGGTGGELR